MTILTPGTYVFIDASNVIYGARSYGWKMDFEKLFHYLTIRFHASRFLYFAGLDGGNKKQLQFYEKLQQFGYELRLVPVKVFKDGRKKADVDARLTFEAMKYINEYQKAIFLTGDGDYYWLFEDLLKRGKDIKLVAYRTSTARELKQLFGGGFTDISRLKVFLSLRQE